MRFCLRHFGLLWVVCLVGCTKPSLLVCGEVLPSGTCRAPTTHVEVGREYALLVTGIGMPHGMVKLHVYRARHGRDERIAESLIRVRDDETFFTSPLTLIHRGEYRIDVVDADGDVFRSVRVHAPRSMFTVPTTAPAMRR